MDAGATSTDCVGPDCLVTTFNSACCPDGFDCLAQIPSPLCGPSPFPVVPPELNNPLLGSNSTSLAATSSSLAFSTSAVLPKVGEQRAWEALALLIPSRPCIQHYDSVCPIATLGARLQFTVPGDMFSALE